VQVFADLLSCNRHARKSIAEILHYPWLAHKSPSTSTSSSGSSQVDTSSKKVPEIPNKTEEKGRKEKKEKRERRERKEKRDKKDRKKEKDFEKSGDPQTDGGVISNPDEVHHDEGLPLPTHQKQEETSPVQEPESKSQAEKEAQTVLPPVANQSDQPSSPQRPMSPLHQVMNQFLKMIVRLFFNEPFSLFSKILCVQPSVTMARNKPAHIPLFPNPARFLPRMFFRGERRSTHVNRRKDLESDVSPEMDQSPLQRTRSPLISPKAMFSPILRQFSRNATFSTASPSKLSLDGIDHSLSTRHAGGSSSDRNYISSDASLSVGRTQSTHSAVDHGSERRPLSSLREDNSLEMDNSNALHVLPGSFYVRKTNRGKVVSPSQLGIELDSEDGEQQTLDRACEKEIFSSKETRKTEHSSSYGFAGFQKFRGDSKSVADGEISGSKGLHSSFRSPFHERILAKKRQKSADRNLPLSPLSSVHADERNGSTSSAFEERDIRQGSFGSDKPKISSKYAFPENPEVKRPASEIDFHRKSSRKNDRARRDSGEELDKKSEKREKKKDAEKKREKPEI
jgi:hypothetical protein